MSLRVTFGLLKAAFWRWSSHNTFRLGAALAYYTIFSLAPLILITVAIAGLFFEEKASRDELLREVNHAVGRQVGNAVASIVESAQDSAMGTRATIIGFVILFFAATSVFNQLQDALNTIWGVKAKKGNGWLFMLKNRLWTFIIVIGLGFLLLASLIVSAVLTAISNFVEPQSLRGGMMMWRGINWLISFGLVTLLFTLIYKLLPDVEIAWSDVWVGALVTALLFELGRYLIELYLGRSTMISAYGAAGSLVVVLMWVYYSSQIFLFGAEFTYVYANRAGKPLIPKENAVVVADEANSAVIADKSGEKTLVGSTRT